jgi:hypothetical protein
MPGENSLVSFRGRSVTVAVNHSAPAGKGAVMLNAALPVPSVAAVVHPRNDSPSPYPRVSSVEFPYAQIR